MTSLVQSAAQAAEQSGAAPLAVAVIAAVALAVVHLLTPSLRFLGGTPRSIWLSIAGGVSVAYVFVHLLPELASGQERVSRALAETGAGEGLGFAERHVYLIALAGLAIFYGLDKLAVRSRRQRAARPGGAFSAGEADAAAGHELQGAAAAHEATGPGVFWIHIGSFAVYNLLIGYLLLHGERRTVSTLAFFTAAMGLHFLVTDFGLNEHHKERYRGIGRWILAVAVCAGLGLAVLTELPEAAVAVLVAFLAGGVILNVLKEEVPEERQSRFWAFALGLAGYAILLLVV